MLFQIVSFCEITKKYQVVLGEPDHVDYPTTHDLPLAFVAQLVGGEPVTNPQELVTYSAHIVITA